MSDPRERLARTITHDRMRHYGYTDDQIVAAEESQHRPECEFTEHGWECFDENLHPYHHDRDELEETAEFVMWVLEHAALADAIGPQPERTAGQ